MSAEDDNRLPMLTMQEVATFPRPGCSAPSSISFTPDNRNLVYLHAPSGSNLTHLWMLDIQEGTVKELIQPPSGVGVESSFSLEEKLRRERARLMTTGITSYVWSQTEGMLLVPIGDTLYVQWASENGLRGDIQQLFHPSEIAVAGESHPILDARPSKDGSLIGFVHHRELHVCGPDGHPRQLTCGASEESGISHGLTDFLAQEEMDRYEGYWFSPDAKLIAFEEVDDSHIPAYRITHQGSEDPSVFEEHRYPFAGQKNPKVRLGVVSPTCSIPGEGVRWMNLESEFGEDFYLANVLWTPAGELMALVQNRAQSMLSLVHLDVNTGESRRVLLEQSPDTAWINIAHMYFPLESGEFVWPSERSGFMHLYLYSSGGDMICPLTQGEWVVDSLCSVDQTQRMLYFMGNKGDCREKHLFSVSLDGGPVTQITQQPGVHRVTVSHDFSMFVSQHSSLDRPLQVDLFSLSDGSLLRSVYQQQDKRLQALVALKPEFMTTRSSDGAVELQLAVYKPEGEGPWPTLVSVYGGPHVQLVSNSWITTADLRAQMLAQRGYLVVKADNRGSYRRGVEFESAIKHNMGHIELTDQVSAVQCVVDRGWCDASRVGIYGWSYGGYMSAMALGMHPTVFKVGVAGAPVTNWDGYDTHYTERYMGTPQVNKDGYKGSAVGTHVANMQGKLLLVHGLIDENVHFRHTATLINQLIHAQKHYEMLLFPNERHSPRSLQDRVYMESRIYDFIQANL